MQDKSNQILGKHDRRTERSLILMILDRPERCSRVELETTLHDIDPLTVSDGLAQLATEGVVIVEGEDVQASRCARHLDALELIGI
jgi:hypothetical protein